METRQKAPLVTFGLMLACVLAMWFDPMTLALWPGDSPKHEPWQLYTYGFAHANGLHLAINMIALLSFGPTLERKWGRCLFLLCYVLAAVVGGLAHLMVVSSAPVVGASGAILGLFAAYVIHKPKARIITPLVIPLPAWVLLCVYIVLSVAAQLFGWLDGAAHVVHLGGAATGALFTCAAYNKAPR